MLLPFLREICCFLLRMRCPTDLVSFLHSHYDEYRAENSGLKLKGEVYKVKLV